ncbi:MULTISPECIES: hypothetical protein [Enterococcaceae]|uniref:hypothetical protein n=1 Tax=Enterococcaceae TaxID=81852 RepID=UPI000E47755E|nr:MULTISPECIES: hypothetical protein [Enterococcaceae]MCI0130171.1 hypothetical protein [Vagococcus sp. CY53-2]RGI31033.1 hypothetical protein DXC12_05395 [Melissococcus sp. OM08-11BH]UNM88995.1 hypothetical protein MN187_06770 [Vagococcus sp. CY52-2]
MKIRIIGYAGSGKTSLAIKLQEKYHIQGISLDDYLKIKDKNKRYHQLNTHLSELPNWIVEGVQVSHWTDKATKEADLIIILDYPIYLTQYRVTKRAFTQCFTKNKTFTQRKKTIKRMFKLYKWNNRFKKRLPDIKKNLTTDHGKLLILESPEDIKRVHRELRQYFYSTNKKNDKK